MGFLLSAGDTLFAGDPPKPGTVIDKNNIMQYKEYFPEMFLEAFTTGWDLIPPFSITIAETRPNRAPEIWYELSEKNKGKYGVDAEGFITGPPEEEIVGYPFPGVKPGDQEFARKYMWNYDYRYQMDDAHPEFTNLQRRWGEAITISDVESLQLMYQCRLFDDPKPNYWTESGWRYVNLLRVLTPPSQQNLITNLIRYKKQRKPDLTYIYLPTMRRVLRGEAGQRATPIASSTQAPDDFFGFAGRVMAFDYKYIGEKKIIGQANATMTFTKLRELGGFDYVYIEGDNWELRDVYVIDIFSKDPTYPQGRKRIWIDKEMGYVLYAAAWDRAGALWKVWHMANNKQKLGGSDETTPYATNFGIDIQLGYAVQMVCDWNTNGNSLRESDVNVSAMRRMAR